MEKKKITFFIVTNDAGVTRKLVVSAVWVKAIGFLSAILFVAAVAGLVDYFGLLVQSVENKKLKAENTHLEKQFQIVETKVNALENALERVKTFSTKLKLITNVDDEDRELRLAMGAQPKPGQAVEEGEVPMEDRPPVEEVAAQDQPMMEKPPVDASSGELSIEGSRDYATLAIRIDRAVKETQLKEQSVLDLWEKLSERQSLLNATPSIRPAKGWFTSRFGYRISPFTGKPVMHAGLDMAAAPGSPVFAPADGVVTFAGFDESYGKLVSIDHGYGVSTRFAHNSQIYVTVGQRVNRWDVISAVGNTGRSTGPHCHYEVRVNGVPVDPMNYILDE
ncbi:MAG: M23 family metallopeptidase [Pseudobdellovibrionaceae bacterium]